MLQTAPQPIRSSLPAAGALLAVSLVLAASLSCVMHWLVVDAPRSSAVAVAEQPALLRAQHAAELWGAAPCTCDTEQPPANAEPLAPTLVLLAVPFVVLAGFRSTCELLPYRLLLAGFAVQPATPPPQA